jgi:hypothetical protein
MRLSVCLSVVVAAVCTYVVCGVCVCVCAFVDQVVGKLREDCNSKVEELLRVQNQMLQQQVELRHREERIKYVRKRIYYIVYVCL